MKFTYDFIPIGSLVTPSDGVVYLDVGNRLEPGVIDHHHPGAPELCTAQLVLENHDFIISQVQDNGGEHTLNIVVHDYPDLDAITSVYFARFLAGGGKVLASFKNLARYVHEVDKGFTRLVPENPMRSN